MIKEISILKRNEEKIYIKSEQLTEKQILFEELQKDTIGRSSSNPTWGYVYNIEDKKLNLIRNRIT